MNPTKKLLFIVGCLGLPALAAGTATAFAAAGVAGGLLIAFDAGFSMLNKSRRKSETEDVGGSVPALSAPKDAGRLPVEIVQMIQGTALAGRPPCGRLPRKAEWATKKTRSMQWN
jgi:hypothetical protein